MVQAGNSGSSDRTEFSSLSPMNGPKDCRKLPAAQRAALLVRLHARFEQNLSRHAGLPWAKVMARLEAKPEKLWSLSELERTGGEPDVVGHDRKTSEVIFADCAPQSPAGRQSLCYDREALDGRKKFPPMGCATELAAAMGAELLSEAQYLALQELGEFDTKTSSWLLTPPEIRRLGGAIFGDRRFGRVFIYHNGAESYYSGRGFRCRLTV